MRTHSLTLLIAVLVSFCAYAQEPAVDTSKTSSAAEAKSQEQASEAASTRRGATDRIDLETTTVTGNRELPNVLHIVPWKKAELGDLPSQPFNTLLDEVLTPVDRDVFRREVTYYGAIADGAKSDAAASTSEAAPERAQ